ncbi:MAG: rRNA pseudouridine synthase [Cyanobacteria bacterium]|nr:rRNA pseudouridine synthase [Cyanobacteriota bacterium]MDW8199955.1 pseudouridine synthase [Cyanobacteriota bacterium SKYGB_h_bin112]
MPERLQKVLAQWGLTSRRRAEQWILAGRVKVNGIIAHLGQMADPHVDQIVVDGVALELVNRPQHCSILVHKPIGVICTCHDPYGRMTVLDLLPRSLHQGQGLHIVGRLDADSTGAVLLTNDGALTNALTHPRHHVAKTYRVWVDGNPSVSTLQEWRQGVMLAGRKTLPATVRVVKRTATQSLLEVVLREGRNRQIRNVAELLGHPVVSLHRVAIGNLQLGNLPVGQYRVLTPTDIKSLRSLVEG